MRLAKYLWIGILLLLAIAVFLVWQQILPLQLVSSILTLVGALLAIITEKDVKQDGKRRLTRWGKVLLAVTAFAGVTSLVTTYQDHRDKETEANTLRANLNAIQAKQDRTQKTADDTQANLVKAQGDLHDEVQNSVWLRRQLEIVGRNLELERASIRTASIEWEIEIPVTNFCLAKYIKEASLPRTPQGAIADVNSTGWHFEIDPNRLPLEDYCKRELTNGFESTRMHVIFKTKGTKDLGLPELLFSQVGSPDFKEQLHDLCSGCDVQGLPGYWYFSTSARVLDPAQGETVRWDDNGKNLFISLSSKLPEEYHQNPAGNRVSLWDLSEAVVYFKPTFDAVIAKSLTSSMLEKPEAKYPYRLHYVRLQLNTRSFSFSVDEGSSNIDLPIKIVGEPPEGWYESRLPAFKFK